MDNPDFDPWNHAALKELFASAWNEKLGVEVKPALVECRYQGMHVSMNLEVRDVAKVNELEIQPNLDNVRKLGKLLMPLLPRGFNIHLIQLVWIPAAFVSEDKRYFEKYTGTNNAQVPRWQIRCNMEAHPMRTFCKD